MPSSYWAFLQRITGGKMAQVRLREVTGRQVNRLLVDQEYGTHAARVVRHRPVYREDRVSERLKALLPMVGSLAT